ncbi:hypothetical protein [Bartonella birtlesii]|uniref:hypothetical protein n=1 Tax=Bartonella birtlesii TaxID=111504 RepID=UPI0002D88748|nr:hypothetical protein [Bartonella birtlesii]
MIFQQKQHSKSSIAKADDVRFFTTFWKHITVGGYLCLHKSTITTTVILDRAQKFAASKPFCEKKLLA